ncbi:hypothetical protein D3C72_1569380 [compost metagenome]
MPWRPAQTVSTGDHRGQGPAPTRPIPAWDVPTAAGSTHATPQPMPPQSAVTQAPVPPRLSCARHIVVSSHAAGVQLGAIGECRSRAYLADMRGEDIGLKQPSATDPGIRAVALIAGRIQALAQRAKPMVDDPASTGGDDVKQSVPPKMGLYKRLASVFYGQRPSTYRARQSRTGSPLAKL